MSSGGARSGSAEPQSKLEEQATCKADLSYSYFLKNTNTSEPPPAPRMLSQEEFQAQQELERSQASQGGSAWNHAGTFEEKCVTSWAKDQLTQMLTGLTHEGVTITSVNSITGDANIWLVRGKRRHGFAFEISLGWKAQVPGGPEIVGTIKIPNADVDDMDDIAITTEIMHKQAERAADEAVALKNAAKMKAPVEKALEGFYAELKKK